MKAQRGFTLIELVVVIVILGILAATALPKFVDLSTEAGDATAQGAAGAISTATSINYAKYMAARGTSTGATQITNGTACSVVGGLIVPPLASAAAANTLSIAGTVGANCPPSVSGTDTTNCLVRYGLSGTQHAAVVTCTN